MTFKNMMIFIFAVFLLISAAPQPAEAAPPQAKSIPFGKNQGAAAQSPFLEAGAWIEALTEGLSKAPLPQTAFPAAVQGAEDSIARLFAVDGESLYLLSEASGFFAQDPRTGEPSLLTVFHFFNVSAALHEHVRYFMLYRGKIFDLDSAGPFSVFPSYDLAMIHFPRFFWADKGEKPPQALRIQPPPAGGPAGAHILSFPTGLLSEPFDEGARLPPLSIEPVSFRGHYQKKLSFMAQTVQMQGKSGAPVVDSEGHALAVVKESVSNFVLGMDLSLLEEPAMAPPCASSLFQCMFEARGELLKLAKAGDVTAQREVILAADKLSKYDYDRLLDTLQRHEKDWTPGDMDKILDSASRERMDILAMKIDQFNKSEDVALFLSSYLKTKESGQPVSANILYHVCDILGGHHIGKESWPSVQPLILECFEDLAGQGFAPGQRNLGLAILSLPDLEERPRQKAEAFKWLGSAALKGDTIACSIVNNLMDLAARPMQQLSESLQNACGAQAF